MERRQKKATGFALLAAVLYAVNIPFSKLLLDAVPATMMAAFLYLGAAKTSTYYAAAPFVGTAISLVLFLELPSWPFFVALVLMVLGAYFAATD